MVHSISILGSTGSIGRQTVAVAEHLGLNVRALTTNRNIQLAEEQARRLHPAFVAVTDEASSKALRIALADTDIAVGGGENALCEAAVISDTDAVVTAVSGAVGLRPTLAAIEKGRRIALANKETLVCAGELVMDVGTMLDGKKAVKEKLIDQLGGISDALEWLYREIERTE